MRALGVLGAAFALLATGCDSARVVDCDRGRFLRAGDVSWCVYDDLGATCPTLLPAVHRLDWGGTACAEQTVEPLPDDPCLGEGRCDGADAG